MSNFKLTLPTLFFLSGFAGLVYEIVWTRQLLLIFGSTTHSVVAVLAAFMAGLALGSLLLGRLADKSRNLLRFYGLLELVVAVSAFSTLLLFPIVQEIYQWLFLTFNIDQNSLLLVKFVLTILVLLPPTIAMGGTLPVLVRFLTGFSPELTKVVSLLYAVNTFGAALGVILTGFVFIELFGLMLSLLLAVSINLLIGFLTLYFSNGKVYKDKQVRELKTIKSESKIGVSKKSIYLVVFAFFLSGLISLAYEVLWTRLLTPSVGTYIYAFSGILGIYLLGIALGSLIYRFLLSSFNKTLVLFGLLEIGIGLSAVLSVVANSSLVYISSPVKILLTIVPGTIFMGMTFPVVAGMFSGKEVGKSIGISYSANTIGTIIGSIAAAFILIPMVGTVKSIFVLSLVNFILGFVLILLDRVNVLVKSGLGVIALALIFITGGFLSQSSLVFQESKIREKISSLKGNYETLFLEDEVASVLGYRQIDGGDRALIIDGVQTTSLGPETPLLAHLPLFLHPDPRDMLVIAFGMGTTFRSGLLHGNVNVDAVDLVPSVPKMMHLFHGDSQEVKSNPRGKIIINDGRNYVKTTDKKYDVIVVDPPPPVNAAGTTVLYSKEFYQDSKDRLKPGGVFVAWFYTGTRLDDFKMLFKSFEEVFPHILVVRSPLGWGYYVFGSEDEISWDSAVLEEKYMNEIFYNDINETRLDPIYRSRWEPLPFGEINRGYLGDEALVKEFSSGFPPITDDRPRTEYFLIRQKKSYEPMADVEQWVKERK